MSRLPPKPRDQLEPAQQETHDLFQKVADRGFGQKFIYQDPKGGLIGPFPFFIHAPQVGKTLQDLIYEIAQLPLPPDARETAILTVGGHFQTGYETYSHVVLAAEAGLPREQAEVLRKGEKKPDGLSESCSVAYDVAQHLVSVKGPLPQVCDSCRISRSVLG